MIALLAVVLVLICDLIQRIAGDAKVSETTLQDTLLLFTHVYVNTHNIILRILQHSRILTSADLSEGVLAPCHMSWI